MQRRLFSFYSLVTLVSALPACSKNGAPSSKAAQPLPPEKAYATVAEQAKGFSVGALTAANTVYVLFDPQCPHCGHLWNASRPLQAQVKFVWVPVSLLNAKSAPQGVALLQAADPTQTMTEHETSLLAGKGGIGAPSSVPDAMASSIQSNTQLLSALGAESVPFVVARHPSTGALITHAGAMDTSALRELLRLSPA